MYVFLSFCIDIQLQKLYISNYDRIISLLRTAIFSKVIISSVISLGLILIIKLWLEKLIKIDNIYNMLKRDKMKKQKIFIIIIIIFIILSIILMYNFNIIPKSYLSKDFNIKIIYNIE